MLYFNFVETENIASIPDGTVTTPRGFFAGATAAGIKKAAGKLDLGILYSEAPCIATGFFTTTRIKAAAVNLSREKLKSGKARAIVVNAGCANAYTGEQGLADAARMTSMAAKSIGIPDSEVLIASTGVTGKLLPMDKIDTGISHIVLDRDGGHDLALAIMTTDTRPKEAAVKVEHGNTRYTIGGIAKGSGMIHPNMATMFCFLTTDATVESGFLKTALKHSVDVSLNMLSVDGDMSPSDTVILMSNGLAKNETINAGSKQAEIFQRALDRICIDFAKKLARDGEGANRLVAATVSGAASLDHARKAAKAVIGSILVKTAIHGGDPNWGRIIAAVSQSNVDLDESKIEMIIGDIAVIKYGKQLDYSEEDLSRIFMGEEVSIYINLHVGDGIATAWGCDMSEEYVTINSEYMT